MNAAKNLILVTVIFGVGLFLGCIITAKSLEIGTPPTIETPIGAALFLIPHYSTPKLAKNAK